MSIKALLKSRRLAVALAGVAGVGVIGLWWAGDVALRMPERVIRWRVLLSTPIGTAPEMVRPYASRVDWFREPSTAPVGCREFGPRREGRTIGTKSVFAKSRGYFRWGSPPDRFPVQVTTCWAFDASDRLLDVVVSKDEPVGTFF